MNTVSMDKKYNGQDILYGSTLLYKLLSARGLNTTEEVNLFLHPDFDRDVHDPFLIMNMDLATERVLTAIENKEKIVIYSDYDMDGIPGAVVLSDFFKAIGYKNIEHYIPSRNIEGFGLNIDAINKLADDGAKLIISVDCGIRAVESVALARERNIDVIITDHHLSGDELPNANVILNPNQKGDEYPNKNLCGAGVAFKLVQALALNLSTRSAGGQPTTYNLKPGWEKWSLDMVAAATISDMVPLVGENRALVHYGLVVLRKSRRAGLRALAGAAWIKQNYITEDDIMFSIAPRINAASRMGSADKALALLTASNDVEAREYAKTLEVLNKERKGVVASMVKQIKKMVPDDDSSNVLLIGDPRWQPGLLGLAAQRSVELFDRPVCVWGRGDAGDIKGSCRSDGSANVVSMLQSASDVLSDFGGHAGSGGFSVATENIHKLRDLLSVYEGDSEKSDNKIDVDGNLGLKDVSWETYRQVEQLSPFGVGNTKPIFLFYDVRVASMKRFGTGLAHLELQFDHPDKGSVKAIKFFADKKLDTKCENGKEIQLIAQMEQSFFGGKPELRLRIVDVV